MAQHPPTGRELSITRDLPLIDEDIVPTTHLCGDAEGAEDIDYGLREILVVVEPLHRIVSDDAEVQIPQIVIDFTTTRDSTNDMDTMFLYIIVYYLLVGIMSHTC